MLMVFLKCSPPTPVIISSMIFSGSSVRGLSEVRISLSLYSQPIAAIVGRFVLSRSPPQPTSEKTVSFPVRIFLWFSAHFLMRREYGRNPQFQLPLFHFYNIQNDLLRTSTRR